MASQSVEVVVVGAGLAGLAAADVIAAAGREVVVLESRDRVGGRTHSVEPVPGAVLDMGAQWVTARHTVLRGLVEELGLDLVDMPRSGDLTVLSEGRSFRLAHDDALAALGLDEVAADAVARLDDLAESVDPLAPWDHPDASTLDARTFASWLEGEVVDADARARLNATAEGYFATPTGEVSLLHALVYARANGGFAALVGSESSPAQQQQIQQGAQAVALGLASRLGNRVRTGRHAVRVEHDDRGVVVRTDGTVVEARAIVLAIPPHLTAELAFSPSLDWQRRHLVQRIVMGSGLKSYAVYDEPFWRADGASGQLVDLESDLVAFDASRADGPGVIVALPSISESRALATATPAERRSAVLDRYVAAFGQRAAEPIHFAESMWAWESESDGEVSVFGCGAWSAFGRTLRAPIGRLVFAGTETSPEFTGQMEGALRSGRRAAGEALSLLDRRDPPASQLAA